MERIMKLPMALSRPSGFLPIIMSGAALLAVLTHVAIFGVAREADEGAAAHLWQILMAGQLPIVVFFAIRWLRKDLRGTLVVLGLQTLAIVAAISPVLVLGL
ncbi:MAG TPA: hypothetical protein VH183_03640 [Burkholderiaceae bacterium]|jgi:hypothetical protein|nr:hypothetical protein [Burkholderiaceae bacterium]